MADELSCQVMVLPARRNLTTILLAATLASAALLAQTVPLPNRADSLKFAVIGDSGRGWQPQLDVAAQRGDTKRAELIELIRTLPEDPNLLRSAKSRRAPAPPTKSRF